MRKRVSNALWRSAAEEQIHASVVELLRIKADPRTIYYHVPNSLPSTARSVARFKKKLGMRPGVADLCIVTPDGLARFLEIKTKDGRQSRDQRAFELHCQYANAPYAIARSLYEADEILSYWGAYKARPVMRRAA